MLLEVLIDVQSGCCSVINRDLSLSLLRCHLLLAVLFQGNGEKQVIYLRIKQQEKSPNTAQVKVAALEGPRQINTAS